MFFKSRVVKIFFFFLYLFFFLQSHKVEEFERIYQDKPGEIRQEKTVIISKDEDLQKEHKVVVHKPTRKNIAPRFVSPLTGMIVDQGADVILEGILDGEFLLN